MKNNIKKQLLFYSLLSFMIIGIITPSIAFAKDESKQSENEKSAVSVNDVIENDMTKETKIDENGNEIIEVNNSKTLEKIEKKLAKPDGVKELESFEIVRENNEDSYLNEDIKQPMAIASVKKTGSSGYCEPLSGGKNSGYGDLTSTVSRGVTTSVDGGFGVDLGVINADLGTTIDKTMEISASKTWNKPESEYGTLQAYSEQSIINYDIYYLGANLSSGDVEWADGVCWATWS